MQLGRYILSLSLVWGVWFAPAYAWFDNNWSYRTAFTVTETDGVAITDQQVELNLTGVISNPDYTWSAAGDDIRALASDDVTPLDFYVESWDQGAETARIQVKIPSLAANASTTVYLYYGNNAAASASDPTATLTETGLRYHTRNSNVDPTNKAQAVNTFNALGDNVTGYGCATVTNFNNISNRNLFSPPARNSNIAFFSNHHFEVTAATAGNWEFRFGGDYGRGGGLYVDDVVLEEAWNDDLWWGFNFNNVAEVLQGTINLTAGFHNLQLIGYEGCCDGGTAVQYRNPTTGGAWQAWSTANVNIRSEKCLLTDVNIASALPNLATSTKTWIDSNGGAVISGDTLRYTITLNESNNMAAERVRVLDDMPALVGNVSIVSIPPGAIDNSSTTGGANGTGFVDVSNINVPANGAVSIVFDVTTATVMTNSNLDNSATITNPSGSANPTVNAPTAVITPNPQLQVVKTRDIATGSPGDIVTYTITVTNNGGGQATNVLLTDDMSPHTHFRLNTYGAGVNFLCTAGCPASGLNLGTATYSNNDAVSFGYAPSSGAGGAPAGYDGNVTDWRLPMTGSFNAGGANFSLEYQAQIK